MRDGFRRVSTPIESMRMSAERLVEQRAAVAWIGKGFAAVALLAISVAALKGSVAIGSIAAGMTMMACAAWSIYHTLAYTARLQTRFEMLKITLRAAPAPKGSPINVVAGDSIRVDAACTIHIQSGVAALQVEA